MSKLCYSVRAWILRHIEQLLHKFGVTVCYQSRYGMKVLNRILPPPQKNPPKYTRIELDPSTLLLSYDCLKDDYTLLGTDIPHSPHYAFMRSCEEGKPCESEYFRRVQQGSLDGRDCDPADASVYLEHYLENRRSLEEGCAKPIWFYTVDGKRYVADGKHRAALAAYLGKSITGIEIHYTPERSPVAMRLLKKMKRHPKVYSRNIEHLEKLFGLQK